MGASLGDLTGQTYGRLTVINLESPARWVCRCECGNLRSVAQRNLRSGQVKSCGCLRLNAVTNDLTDQRFDRLIVLAREGSAKGGVPLWRCLCDCGKEVVVRGINLRSGNTKSCGCRRVDVARARSKTHGLSKTLAYKRWESIKQRTTNPENPSYRNYGARGITMCSEWVDDFEAFYAATGDPPFEGASLDRIDNDGNYEPRNVRWADASTQMLNRQPYKRATRAEREMALARVAKLESRNAGLESRIAELEAALERATTSDPKPM